MNTHDICLNMIVKNESHVIKDTLENICKTINISYYVISDTGSTDNTVEIIKEFFDSRNIKGEIHLDEWKDFGYNRSLALAHAYKKTKYLIIFDADDRFVGDFKMPDVLDKDSYYFRIGTGVVYKRILLVSNHLKWSFMGVLHEFIWCHDKDNKDITNEYIEGNYYIESGKTGNRSSDPLKYQKDAAILEKAFYEAEKNNNYIKIRYSFYIAQSYRDSNQKEKAIEWYKKRAEFKDWNQEVYFSYFMVGKLYNDLQQYENAVYYWNLAYEADPERIETIYEIISHYRKKDQFKLALQYYNMIKNNTPDIADKLFIYHPIYDFLLNYEMSIICHYTKQYDQAIIIYDKLFQSKTLVNDLKINILDNYIFYISYIPNNLEIIENIFNFINSLYIINNNVLPKHVNIANKVIDFIKPYVNNIDNIQPLISKLPIKNLSSDIDVLKPREEITIMLTMTTCKRYNLFSQTINSFLRCCKDIHLVTSFFCVDDNSSEEDQKNMKDNYPFFQFYFKKEEEKGHLKSMNIIWDKLNELKPTYWLHIEDDWLFFKPSNYIQKSIDFLKKYKDQNIHQILFNKNYAETFQDYDIVGGQILDEKKEFLLHIKDQKGLTGKSCTYWPHYSFRPSLTITDTILKLGNYDSPNTFFEVDYSNKYFKNGFQSAFFNEINSIHIGKLTSERNNNNIKNAYDLNNITQFNSIQKKEDNDVKQNNYINNDVKQNNCQFIHLYDNKNITNNECGSGSLLYNINYDNLHVTQTMQILFKNNNFGSNKKIIHHILTHYNIWKKLKFDTANSCYVVTQHNISNNIYLPSLIELSNKCDIIILKDSFYENKNEPSTTINYHGFVNDNGMKKLSSYIINKKCLDKIFEHVYKNGINNNIIDTLTSLNLSIVTTKETIIYYDENIIKENKIENKYECFDLDHYNNRNTYLSLNNLDHIGDDIEFHKDIEINDLIHIADNNENIIAFNNLGYVKNNVNLNTLHKIPDNYEKKINLFINIHNYNMKYSNKIINNPLIVFNNKIIKNNEIKLLDTKNINELTQYTNNSNEYVGFCTNGSIKNTINIADFESNTDGVNTYIDLVKYVKTNYSNIESNNINYEAQRSNYINCGEAQRSNYINYSSSIDNYIYLEKSVFTYSNILDKDQDKIKNNIQSHNLLSINEMINYANINDNIMAFNKNNFYNNLDIILDNSYPDNGIYIKIREGLIINGINIYEEYKKEVEKKNKIRIKLICNKYNSTELCNKLNKISMGQMKWNNVEFTDKNFLIDYFVILDGIYDDTYYIPSKTMVIHQKDVEIINNNYIKIQRFNHFYSWNINKTFFELKYNNIEKKYNKILIQESVLNKNVQLYNLNLFYTYSDIENKNYNNIHEYKYCIVTEYNETLWDSILSECITLYYGVYNENLDQYKSVIVMDNKEPISYKMIHEIIVNDTWEKKFEDIKNDKLKILDNDNILAQICKNI